MRRIVFVWLLVFLFIAVPSSGGATQPEAITPLIRVGLWEGQRSLSLSSDSGFVVLDKGQQKIASYTAGEKVFLNIKDGKLSDGSKNISGLELQLQPLAADGVIIVNNRPYRGRLLLQWNTVSGMQVVNLLDVEQYLYSIVPGEMPSAWHMEALKAQSVAARSFAMAGFNAHRSAGYDVCATTHCQVYTGCQTETERARQAVDATAGLILLYKGQAVTAVFHSSSGGWTEDSQDIWARDVPYLRSVEDYDVGTPNFKWEKKFSPESLAQRLNESGYIVGTLRALELSKLNYGGVNSHDRTKRGRLKEMRFIGDQGSITLSGERVRDMLGLKSTLFDIELEVPSVRQLEVEVGNMSRKQIDINLPPYKETTGWPTDRESIRRLSGRNGEMVVITGYGFGHGLGMSQWGAKQMAEKVPETDTKYFAAILNHYYTDVQLRKIY